MIFKNHYYNHKFQFFLLIPFRKKLRTRSEVKTVEGYIHISLEKYVRTTSHEGYMSFSRWPHTDAVRVTARNRSEEGLWSTGRSGWRKPPGKTALATTGHCLASWPVTLTACVRGHLEKDIYPSWDAVRTYISWDICLHYILLFLKTFFLPWI